MSHTGWTLRKNVELWVVVFFFHDIPWLVLTSDSVDPGVAAPRSLSQTDAHPRTPLCVSLHHPISRSRASPGPSGLYVRPHLLPSTPTIPSLSLRLVRNFAVFPRSLWSRSIDFFRRSRGDEKNAAGSVRHFTAILRKPPILSGFASCFWNKSQLNVAHRDQQHSNTIQRNGHMAELATHIPWKDTVKSFCCNWSSSKVRQNPSSCDPTRYWNWFHQMF